MTRIVVTIECKVNAIVIEQVETKVLVIESVHASQRIPKQHTEQNAYGSTVHAD